ncbi:Uncharacterised protein [Yersinia pseudotuberculosis]|uniref:Uncharacterized protein n=1 Tax=Yersinia pseudotuberculosis serotype O:3 (strain YPIII) TaxID=502800 RepID=A0A0H3AYX0_YERPY|nr:hypothetical protein BZ22_728 [Yersinia pseudotuberculosis YPIII]SQA49172.1 Uncharacterised protein [Yersinia pseudotuberculosis]
MIFSLFDVVMSDIDMPESGLKKGMKGVISITTRTIKPYMLIRLIPG